ncbi:MAG: hypothetical protein IJE78_09915 [Bacteroidaceae bacterium]|nr:hypothetical protein [Bacteroidaceae bacterium]
MKNTKRLLAMLLCVTLSLSIFATTVSAASGTCEVFYFNECGVGPGGTASIQSSLQNMGYTANRYADTHAYYVRRTMHQDKVFAIVTHGSPGRVYCGENTTMSAAAVSNDDANYSLAAWFGRDSLQGVSFVYYGACQSANTDSSYGNLLTYTTTGLLGAKSALGFTENVWDPHTAYYEGKLFSYLGNGYSVNLSNILARSATYNYYGSYGEVDSAVISGDSSTKIYTTRTTDLAENTNCDPTELVLVQSLFGNQPRAGVVGTSSSLHDNVFGYDMDALRDNNYLYLFNADDKTLEAIALVDENNAPIFGAITSEENAIDMAKQFAAKATNILSVDACDAFCSVIDADDNRFYSIELWEKTTDNFFTGNKVAIMIDSNGILQSYVANVESTDIRETTSTQKHISEDAAIKAAYVAVAESANKLESIENSENCTPKTGNDTIISDSGLAVNRKTQANIAAKYKINVANAENHTVTTYKEYRDGVPCWVITIDNVETNRFWDVSFSVVLNAETGSIISVDNTR